MACSPRLGFRRSEPLNLRWFTVQGSLLFGRMDGSHHRRRGVGYYTDTAERVFCALPGLRQSVYRAELHAIAR
eukprot:777169-Amphidinium_carterae.1